MINALTPTVFLQHHPLTLAGCRMGRVVTVIRLASGNTVIHSTAAFLPEHVAEIRDVGEPSWLVEATNFHDTCAKEGRAAFPDIPYMVSPGFRGADRLNASALAPLPSEWDDEIDVIEVGGMPKIQEHVFFHRPSKTLIVADLLFNLSPDAGRWTHGFTSAMAGIRAYPGMSRLYRFCIKDRAAYTESMRTVMALDFERIVVAHGDPIVDNAKAKLQEILAMHGLAPQP